MNDVYWKYQMSYRSTLQNASFNVTDAANWATVLRDMMSRKHHKYILPHTSQRYILSHIYQRCDIQTVRPSLKLPQILSEDSQMVLYNAVDAKREHKEAEERIRAYRCTCYKSTDSQIVTEHDKCPTEVAKELNRKRDKNMQLQLQRESSKEGAQAYLSLQGSIRPRLFAAEKTGSEKQGVPAHLHTDAIVCWCSYIPLHLHNWLHTDALAHWLMCLCIYMRNTYWCTCTLYYVLMH